MMIVRNPYEKLRHPEYAEPSNAPAESYKIYGSSKESVVLMVAPARRQGAYVFGYTILFQDGREVTRHIGEYGGWFGSVRDARLFFLGHMLQYRKHFSEDCIWHVKKEVLSLTQTILPGFGPEETDNY